MTQEEIMKEAKRLQKEAPWAIEEDGLWMPKGEPNECSECKKKKCNINW